MKAARWRGYMHPERNSASVDDRGDFVGNEFAMSRALRSIPLHWPLPPAPNRTRDTELLPPVCQRTDRRRGSPLTWGLELLGEAAMSSLSERGKETARNERVIGSVRDRTGAPLAVVRSLFAQEFSRLELGAKVRSYLAVLTASNVRAILRRKRRMLP